MLSQENRLKKVRDFEIVMKKGRWINGQFLDLKAIWLPRDVVKVPKKENSDNFKKQLKLAFSVGVKVSKSAVVRNRLKRQMREVVRLLQKEGKLKNGYYILCTAKKPAVDKSYAEISQDLTLLLKKSGLLI